MSGKGSVDGRSARTRAALVGAFNRLFLRRGPRRLRVADLIGEAGVGRSTFYDHYQGAGALMLAALEGPLAVLAAAAAGHGDPQRLEGLLAHFWENRQRARELLAGRAGERVARLLAAMVEERLDGALLALPPPLAARQLAEAALGPVRAWIFAAAPSTPAELAAAVCRGGAALAAAQVQSAR